jgi:hypothetical protein
MMTVTYAFRTVAIGKVDISESTRRNVNVECKQAVLSLPRYLYLTEGTHRGTLTPR